MPTHLLPARVKHEFQRMTMGRQTSQYSLCIYVTQFTFYMVSSTFYAVNLFTFCIVNLSFYRVNFFF